MELKVACMELLDEKRIFMKRGGVIIYELLIMYYCKPYIKYKKARNSKINIFSYSATFF